MHKGQDQVNIVEVYLSEKNILITRSISKFISAIYFSFKITIKE